MIDSRSPMMTSPVAALKEAIQLGFYVGSGVGLAGGSAISIAVGNNLLWQAGGLLVGSLLGIVGGSAYGYFARRMKTAPAVYRP